MFKWLADKLTGWLWDLLVNLRVKGETMLSDVVTPALSHIPGLDPVSVHSSLAGINYFFPLGETVAMISALAALWSMVNTYRTIKSWIPFLSGS
jgi:hypothetical protein